MHYQQTFTMMTWHAAGCQHSSFVCPVEGALVTCRFSDETFSKTLRHCWQVAAAWSSADVVVPCVSLVTLDWSAACVIADFLSPLLVSPCIHSSLPQTNPTHIHAKHEPNLCFLISEMIHPIYQSHKIYNFSDKTKRNRHEIWQFGIN